MNLKKRSSEATDEGHRVAIDRAIRAMHDRIDEKLTLADMAAAAYISPFHFDRIFHRIVGLPPGHFLSALRMQAAKKLLITTQRKVIDVCLEVGFASPGTFSRRFRDLVGISPKSLRRIARNLNGGKIAAEMPYRSDDHGHEASIEGLVTAPDDFNGTIFVGLFESPLPQSRPESCAILKGPGRFTIPRVADGEHYVLSLAFPTTVAPWDLLFCDSALRGGSTLEPVRVVDGRHQGEPVTLVLRPAEPTDPPILLTLPWLISQLPAVRRGLINSRPVTTTAES